MLRLSLTENCSSYKNSAYICNKSPENDKKKTFETYPCKTFSCIIRLMGGGAGIAQSL